MAGVVHFVKMHGLGNDFVVADGRNAAFDPADYAQLIADRRFGVGCDQLILVRESRRDDCDVRMEIINADGSRVEMCGNGIRCLALWLVQHCGYRKATFRVDTDAGVIVPTLVSPEGSPLSANQVGLVAGSGSALVRVDMGPATFATSQLPADVSMFATDELVNSNLEVDGANFVFCGVQVGNPHFVTLVDDVNAVELEKIGPRIENHAAFPNRINVEFVQVLEDGTAKTRVWERGSGATLACGTGATAVGAALMRTGRANGTVTVALPGGNLAIEEQEGRMFMTGPANSVCCGTLVEEQLEVAQRALPR